MPNEILLNCEATPFMHKGFMIFPQDQLESRVRGQIDIARLKLFTHESQKTPMGTEGLKLRHQLRGRQVVPACVLDQMIANQSLIPTEWKMKGETLKPWGTKGKRIFPLITIFFWGTIYRDHEGLMYVRYLFYKGKGKENKGQAWDSDNHWLGLRWDGNNPALIYTAK